MEADNHDSASASPTTSPSSQWIRSIQNESFQPKPTAYSPHSLEDEDPLMLQQRQCRDKLRVLKKVRERIKFYPLQHLDKRGNSSSYSMKISTSMILSGADESPDWQKDAKQSDGQSKNVGQNVGIDELGGLEMLLFAFFSPQELLRVSGVCRAWRALARDDLFWEPLLVTQLEKYPLRPLLGLERDPTRPHEDVPAILVYMVYQRLKIAQTAYKTECSDTTNNIHTATTNAAATRYNGRFLEIFQTINRQGQVGALLRSQVRPDEPVSSVHLVCVKFNSAASALRTQNQEMTRMVELHLQAVAHQAAPPVEAPNAAVLVPDQQQPVVHGAGAADDEDVYSVADGRDRMTLNGWLSTKRRVSERTLRSYLRQMLLAVFALERSNCEHADISPVNIVVHCQSRVHKGNPSEGVATGRSEESDEEEEDDDLDMLEAHRLEAKPQHTRRRTPFFQLFLSRRNCQHTGGTRNPALDPVLAVDADMNVPAPILDVNGEIAQQRQRLAAVEAEVGVGGNGIAAAFRNRIALPQASMVGSVVQTAMTVWARGRFVDANTSTVLALLLRFPDSFSSSLRSFLEYAKYLIITHSVSASKLLRHEYLQCSATELDRRSSPHWSTTQIHDVNEYKSKLVAYYGDLPSRVEGLLDDNPQVIDELMPRTNLGLRYFSRALEENNLRSERFVSVVAPSTASSSWVRTLASTQTCTLQRLDLSRARVPTSVLLRELATLPRLTHLRLPRQILRDENLEHLVAALAYAKFLPQLRGLDEDVRQAIDRLEKSYLMQLDMVTFLLQKPSVSNTAPGARTGD
ncbi:hypothetical protein PC129_g3895 [Phytophthora cactorum]|uniref:F-box domain-containing protein n=2 Tax=Phytophthora cactorum TaxID=29920 RepID=A0A329SRU1_9STRA|nr:hypothetical protein Pcac1_g3520 [Phytophthora cactorum]KAG2834822.1 hypothetical protein PC112_g5935 [Phytophthora cactorum]KAG2844415.1 hypothetical protein PC111_g1981 [Phytophthora cactorum]KAG2863043.1 hypothetical protein PC113_g5759 [Phytophthora cactorum]KAG2920624.1 hypothetical protein PC114_g6025 [Phytophthora cactorum]